MIALCVDNEEILLNVLKNAVLKSPDISKAVSFLNGADALLWAKSNKFDIAFLDIELSDMNGIELSKQLRELSPYVPIFFCTSYPQYSIDAIRAHANGYILKTITPEKIQREIDYLKGAFKSRYLLRINCQNGFFMYDMQGSPIVFPRKKSTELLALLIYYKDKSLSAIDLCDYLWPELGGGGNEANKNHLYKLLSDIRKKLKELRAEAILVKDGQGYRLDMSLIEDISPGHDNYMYGYDWVNK